MAATPTVQIEGLTELRSALRELGDKGLKKGLGVANKKAAEVVVRRAEPRVPVRTGKLKASLRATGSQRSGEARAGRASGTKYAAAVHWGRRKGNVGSPPGNHPGKNPVKGVPFLYDAAQASQGEVVEVYAKEIQVVLDRLHWRAD